ncbi:OB-fold nucleic acid binding domain protein [Talaromyces islandicus]|uniref:OB-fold nucleic acid binding domain protein n=1 Tax=Talaromyces islandicus TaxID=28573 RepID=A0A0U1MAD0_TALIS|nr:OB-fold nucleic acid binding domain protein [Talaromyces islandicus]
MAKDASSTRTSITTTHDAGDAHHPFYPAFCFPASPTHFAWVKLSIADIHRLRPKDGFEGQNVYFYNNHPIQFVCLAGVIVTRDEYERRTVLNIDDSSGANIEVIILKAAVATSTTTTTLPSPATARGDYDDDDDDDDEDNIARQTLTNVTSTARSPIDTAQLRVGAVVKIKGTLSIFRATMQVVLERFWVLHETNAEVKFWNERARFLVDVLSVPWSLTPEIVEALRRRARDEETDTVSDRRRVVEKQRRLEERERKDYKRILKRWDKEERLREKEAEWITESNKRLETRLAKEKAGNHTDKTHY